MPSPSFSPLRSRIASNLTSARAETGLTQKELAFRVGADSNQISKWERGLNIPSPHYLDALADALGRDVGWFHWNHTESVDEAA